MVRWICQGPWRNRIENWWQRKSEKKIYICRPPWIGKKQKKIFLSHVTAHQRVTLQRKTLIMDNMTHPIDISQLLSSATPAIVKWTCENVVIMAVMEVCISSVTWNFILQGWSHCSHHWMVDLSAALRPALSPQCGTILHWSASFLVVSCCY